MARYQPTVCGVVLVLVLVTSSASQSAWAETAGNALKARERAFLLGTEPERASLVPREKAGAAGGPISPRPEDGTLAPLPQSLSVSLGDLAARAAGMPSTLSAGVLDFWVEGHYAPHEVGSELRILESGAMSLVSAGTSYKLGPDIMIGALASLDQGALSHQMLRSEAETSGWIAGPFASVKLGHGIVFDGRVAWGDGSIEERGGEAEPRDGAAFGRTIVKGTLRGTRDFAGWSLTPMAGFTLMEETAQPHGEAALLSRDGRVEVTPELKRRMAFSSGLFVEPSFAAGAFLPIQKEADAAALLSLPAPADVHLKASAGVAVGVADGVTVKAQGGVETAGPDLPDIWSGRLQLNMPLGK